MKRKCAKPPLHSHSNITKQAVLSNKKKIKKNNIIFTFFKGMRKIITKSGRRI